MAKQKTGALVVTTHLYDGKKSLPLDIELYQHASSLPAGKEDENFKKKPEIAVELIDRSLKRKYRPKIILLDAGYGNNVNFLQELEKRNLKYLGGVAKNRKIIVTNKSGIEREIRIDELAKSLSPEGFETVVLSLQKPKTLYVATFTARISRWEEQRTFAIVMNASSFESATDIDYFITSVEAGKVTAQWVVETYSQRNWIEVFSREALMVVGVERIPSPRKRKPLPPFYFGILCLHFYSLAKLNRRTPKAMGEQIFRDVH